MERNLSQDRSGIIAATEIGDFRRLAEKVVQADALLDVAKKLVAEARDGFDRLEDRLVARIRREALDDQIAAEDAAKPRTGEKGGPK